jgi:hypothetical protein
VDKILPITTIVLFFVLNGLIHYRLIKYIRYLESKCQYINVQLNGRNESVLRLDNMVIEALNGQLVLIEFIKNSQISINPNDLKNLHDWELQIKRVKEVSLDRWREQDEARVNSSNVNG